MIIVYTEPKDGISSDISNQRAISALSKMLPAAIDTEVAIV